MSVVSIHGSVVPAASTTAVPTTTVADPDVLPLISASGAVGEAVDGDSGDSKEEDADTGASDDDSEEDDTDDGFGDDDDKDDDGFKDGLDDDEELDEFDDIDEDDFDDDFDDDFEEELDDDYEIATDSEVSAEFGLNGEDAGKEAVDDGLDDFDDFDKVE